MQIDVICPIDGTDIMKCKLYVDRRSCTIGMPKVDYEQLMRDNVFIRDGKSIDAAGVINTTRTFVEEKDNNCSGTITQIEEGLKNFKEE